MDKKREALAVDDPTGGVLEATQFPEDEFPDPDGAEDDGWDLGGDR